MNTPRANASDTSDTGLLRPDLPNAPNAPTPPPGNIPPAIAALFRRSLAQGRVHPLMPLLQRYRQAAEGEVPP